MANDAPQKQMIQAGFILLALCLIIKLFAVQIVNKDYKLTAANNAFKHEVVYPTRGLLFDRNHLLLVGNQTAYDIMITPSELEAFDTTEFCKIFSLEREDFFRRFDAVKAQRRKIGFQSVSFLNQVEPEQYARFTELNYKFPGFSGQARNTRHYPKKAGGNLLGYLVEVDQNFLDKHPEYKQGDYIGKSGIEQTYESYLKGEKGYSIYLRDVHNRIKAPYQDGAFDKMAVPGKDIITTIDAELQAFGEKLMQNKVGCAVAIEPSTGEILTLVTSPGITTEQLNNMGKYYRDIVRNPLTPMFNRAVMSPYPPGSVFKLVNGLIGLQEDVVRPQTQYGCNKGYKVGRGVACHVHKSPIDMYESIQMSCNAYYCHVFRNILDNSKYANIAESFTKWREYVESFGFGKPLGSDFPSEQGGSLPSVQRYNRYYGKNRWSSLTLVSLSIGQGEIGATPLQLANLSAIMANRGYYFTPHMVRDVLDTTYVNPYTQPHYTMVDTSWFPVIVEGMSRAVNSPPGAGGTARIAKIEGIELCGKTGTAQNPHGKDNSVFICFGPRENPKIAIAVYIEKGGFGATWAAPIASLLAEFYLKREIPASRQPLLKTVLEGNLMDRFKR